LTGKREWTPSGHFDRFKGVLAGSIFIEQENYNPFTKGLQGDPLSMIQLTYQDAQDLGFGKG